MATKKTKATDETEVMDKKKALSTALSQIEKSYGKGSIMKLGDLRPRILG